ncbi:hypothetical protein H9P43_000595 [Blastocladiella emersonii ATCC 22665]|nr:hypothetical protein H9P43_000595 [Blastocladiella emersonii ATCC 22665]
MSSKYDKLPDIARDQPDVYETPDVSALPAAAVAEDSHNAGLDAPGEDDDAVAAGATTGHGPAEFSDGEDTDGVVVRTRLSVRAAAGKFANVGVDASGADFSGAIGSRTAMFRTYNRAAYEALARSSRAAHESPAQKLARLREEMKQLETELSSGGVNGGRINPAATASGSSSEKYADAFTQLSSMAKDLDELQARAGGAAPPTPAGEGVTASRLLDHLKSYRETTAPGSMSPPLYGRSNLSSSNLHGDDPTSPTTATAAAAAAANQVTYEVYYTPETSALVRSSKLADMDARVHALEKVVGHTVEPDLVPLDPLVTLVARLDRHLDALANPRQLDALTRHLRALNEQMAMAQAQHHAGASRASPGAAGAVVPADLADKVDALYALVDKVDPLVPVVHRVLDRMQALHALHADAATFAATLRRVAADQGRVDRAVRDLTDAVARLDRAMVDNATTVQGNVISLEERVAALAARIDRLTE